MIFVDVQAYGEGCSEISAKELAIYGPGVKFHAVYAPPPGVTKNFEWCNAWGYLQHQLPWTRRGRQYSKFAEDLRFHLKDEENVLWCATEEKSRFLSVILGRLVCSAKNMPEVPQFHEFPWNSCSAHDLQISYCARMRAKRLAKLVLRSPVHSEVDVPVPGAPRRRHKVVQARGNLDAVSRRLSFS